MISPAEARGALDRQRRAKERWGCAQITQLAVFN
jgi:hypothetical protein